MWMFNIRRRSSLVYLGLKFEPTIAVITSRSDSYNVNTASALPLASESRALQPSLLPELPMTINLAMSSKDLAYQL